MRVPKKHPKNLSKNQFSDAFWHPKIEEKSYRKRRRKKNGKKRRKKTSKTLKKNRDKTDKTIEV